jgi:hypothetical protein
MKGEKNETIEMSFDELVAKFKAEHGEVHVLEIIVSKDEKGNPKDVAKGIFKNPNRQVMGMAIKEMSGPLQAVGAGDVIIDNCWLGGDERIQTNEKIRTAACVHICQIVELYDGSVKKA